MTGVRVVTKPPVFLPQETRKPQRVSLDQCIGKFATPSFTWSRNCSSEAQSVTDQKCLQWKKSQRKKRVMCSWSSERGAGNGGWKRSGRCEVQTFNSLGGWRNSWKSLKFWETRTANAKASCPQMPLRRVSVCLSCTSVVRAGNRWLVCHTHQQKQSVSMFR